MPKEFIEPTEEEIEEVEEVEIPDGLEDDESDIV